MISKGGLLLRQVKFRFNLCNFITQQIALFNTSQSITNEPGKLNNPQANPRPQRLVALGISDSAQII